MNGLFPDDHQHQQPTDEGHGLAHHGDAGKTGDNPAVELIRSKINALYASEPNARQELLEAKQESAAVRSKHQQYMYDLSTSGRPLAEIQTAWHQYYLTLSDAEKREVWQEFYAASGHLPTESTRIVQSRSAMTRPHTGLGQTHGAAGPAPAPIIKVSGPVAPHTAAHPMLQHHARRPKTIPLPTPPAAAPAGIVVSSFENDPVAHRPHERRSAAAIRKQILRQVRASNSAQIKAKQHLQSLAFGLGLGALVILILLFGFFNEVVIAPFIQPNAHAEATPIILAQGSAAPNATPEVIVPKINAQLPTVYGTSTTEADIQKSLEEGVVHYASTAVPGQQGNTAFFGHSSNNIFNKGKYKFAFVLLHELVPGDLFYLSYNGKTYTYRVFQKRVVEPTETWVLNPVEGKTATATLITCDPPGTSLHRLVVWGEQIDPDPNANSAPAATPPATQPAQLSSNGPTLLGRFWHWATPW